MRNLIIKYLCEGFTQNEIAEKLKADGFKPCSLSAIEKELNKIRAEYKAKTMFHLAYLICTQK